MAGQGFYCKSENGITIVYRQIFNTTNYFYCVHRGRLTRISWREEEPRPVFIQIKLDDYIEDINNITETERSLLLLNESIELID